MFRSRRVLSANEIIAIIEELDDEDINDADVYIDPPRDGAFSDEDSGDEDCNSPDRLNRHQLLAPAELVLNNDQSEVFCEPISQCQSVETSAQASSSSTRKIKKRQRTWIKRDLQADNFHWENPPPRSVTTLSKDSDPLDFFELFFDPKVIEHFVRHSVMYAVEKHNTNFTLSADEMYCFIGILVLSGYAPLPRRRMYWEENEDTHNILVSKSMRRNRFEEIFKYLHVADNQNLQIGDKMAKIRPMFDIMNEKFLIYAPIEKDISIDESMIPYYGRHGCKQHIRGKPIRFGFKAWVAATRLGYCLQVNLYEGRSERVEPGIGLGEDVVTKLTSVIQHVYPDTKFSIYCDNFFTSPSLLSNLKDKGVYITGTVRQNRTDNCPLLDIKSCKKHPRGFYDYRLDTNDNICAVRWHDNNIVTLLSNEYGVQPIRKAQRYSVAAKKRISIDQPNVIHKYNTFMGGVDRLDANIGVYRIAIRGKKWYIPILFWLIDVVINNATLLARSFGNNVDTLEFRRSIARSLLQKYGISRLHTGPIRPLHLTTTVPVTVRRHGADHIILTGQIRRRCALCKNKTVKMCKKCNVNLHDKCFNDFHTK